MTSAATLPVDEPTLVDASGYPIEWFSHEELRAYPPSTERPTAGIRQPV
jgi:hypothetical protein